MCVDDHVGRRDKSREDNVIGNIFLRLPVGVAEEAADCTPLAFLSHLDGTVIPFTTADCVCIVQPEVHFRLDSEDQRYREK